MTAPTFPLLALPALQTTLTTATERGYPRTGLVVFVVLALLLSIFRRRLSPAQFWIPLFGGTLAAISLSSRMAPGERIAVFCVLAVLVGVGLYQQRRPILQYLFFCRFPLMIGLLLLALPFLGLGPMRSLFRNLFVTSAGGVFLVALLAFLAAWVVLITARITAGGIPERFLVTWNPDGSAKRPGPVGSLLQLALSGLLALPTVCAVVALSPESASSKESASAGIGWPLLMAFLGMVGALLLFYAAYLFGRYLAPPGSAAAEWDLLPLPLPPAMIRRLSTARISWASERRERIERTFAAQGADVRAGYLDSKNSLRPGLGLASSFAFITFAVYGVCYFLLHPDGLRVEPPALANVLFLLILLGWILPCLSFFLDRFRVPLVAFLAGLTFLLYFISDIDHYYMLNDLSDKETTAKGSTKGPQAIIPERQVESNVRREVEDFLSARRNAWARRHSGRDPVLVAVAASGGGITASLWTAKVLAELQREFGPELSESIYGLSTVSGGSVGAMYFIDAFGPDGRAPAEESLQAIVEKAGTSSLAATAWGLAYPDFWRGFSLQNPFRPFFDRAWAMEQVWRRTLRPDGTEVPTLRTWRAGVSAGVRPAALFNATIAETGERLVLSPLKLNPLPGGCVADDPGFDDCVDARTFTQLYEDKDLPVTTAARLSATFPFVSPITRPRLATSDDLPNAYHVADGGYYDNYGVVTLVEGLQRVLKIYGRDLESPVRQSGAPRTPRKILVVEIRASDSKAAKEAKRRAGWAFGTAGPVLTLLNVWGSGQTPRNDLDLQLLREVAAKRGFEVETVLFPLVAEAPLSWDLTASQKEQIERGWDWCAAMPEREGQKSKIEIGLAKTRAFLRKSSEKSAGWEDLPPTRYAKLPSGVSPAAMQDFCLGKAPER